MKVLVWLIFGSVMLGGLLLIAVIPSDPLGSRRPSAPRVDCSLQDDRLKFIDRLKRERIITKIDQPASIPQISVGVRFHVLDFEDKQTMMSPILAYYVCQGHRLLRLLDSRTGHTIGTLDTQRGLQLR